MLVPHMKRACRLVLVVALVSVAAACGEPVAVQIPPVTVASPGRVRLGGGGPEEAPMTKKLDVFDDLHGTRVADPYRWLEDSESSEVRAWSDQQNAHTRAVLGANLGREGRESLRNQVRELLQIGYVSSPSVRGTKTGTFR